MVREDAGDSAECASTWCMVTLEQGSEEHLDWVNLRALVKDTDYYIMDISAGMVFYFFKSPAMATMFKLTFAGI